MQSKGKNRPLRPHHDAKEKSRLRKAGFPIDDVDLHLTGTTAITHNLIMVTNTTAERLPKQAASRL